MMKPRDEREPGKGEPMLSFNESAKLQAQIAGMILAAMNVGKDLNAWESSVEHRYTDSPSSSERCNNATEQARELMMNMGLYRLIPKDSAAKGFLAPLHNRLTASRFKMLKSSKSKDNYIKAKDLALAGPKGVLP